MSRRLLVQLLVLVALAGLVPGCKKSEGTTASSGTQAALTKPSDQLTAEDVSAALVGLGWKVSSSTRSTHPEVSNFMVTGSQEHPQGKESPDGKKRIFLTVALFTIVDSRLEGEKTRLAQEYATDVQGNRVLAVKVFPKETGDAKTWLGKLTGK